MGSSGGPDRIAQRGGAARVRVVLLALVLLLGASACGRIGFSDHGSDDAQVSVDAGVFDASLADAGPDAGRTDAGLSDAGPDAGRTDAGLDAGGPDASLPDAGPGGAAPRPIYPPGTSVVTSRRPRLRWSSASGTDSTRVELCEDRACSRVITTLSSASASAAPTSDLPTGPVYWRLTGLSGGSPSTAVSPTWLFYVGARSAAVDSAWGTTADFDSDGLADLLAGSWGVSGGAGRVYVHLGSAAGISATPTTSLDGPDGASSSFGQTLRPLGDVNGDGRSDLAVSAIGAAAGMGRVHVFHGGAGGLLTVPATSIDGPPGSLTFFGQKLAGIGDVNGDGYADLALSAFGFSGHTGRVYVHYGSATGVSATPSVTLDPPVMSRFGSDLAGSCDVNGDGFSDLIVGAELENGFTGAIYVFHGSASGISSTATLHVTGRDGMNSNFGGSVNCAGDPDGDGYADVLVGAPSGPTAMRVGAAYLFRGSATGLSAGAFVRLAGMDGANADFGDTVATAGDVNGDGLSDVLVASPNATGASARDGKVYLFLGGPSGLATTAAVTFVGSSGSGSYGSGLGTPGDVDGDGRDDIVVGDPIATGGNGAVYVFRGATPLPSATAMPAIPGRDVAMSAQFGNGIAYR